MRLEYYPVEKLKKEIIGIIGKHLDLNQYAVFFFGSRVAGNNFPRADIDLGVEGPEEVSAEKKLMIEEELDSIPTLYKIDFIDFKRVSEKFKKEAKKIIELIK
ncbi:MAG: hypothetical protein A3H02_03155 [Candidatus Niyogibacteria bacterium RIFCSPLOWO2_12_FULL_41_13]|uniref:Polymerase beta nucleotidyltransferase domain-containing protein n=1 Tax=Candidatus Niyogibacteria bacterium RIFCSPLOWO2_12_FULL_41_13 TaxID=1801726 RepID=A0A1G2F232_9BACT|nr:MAG: hypothetical protein A3H02_03155 [Candidatus Niyogibacteria bacterium RIFCSPLOWO2_12_FULL_41_13]